MSTGIVAIRRRMMELGHRTLLAADERRPVPEPRGPRRPAPLSREPCPPPVRQGRDSLLVEPDAVEVLVQTPDCRRSPWTYDCAAAGWGRSSPAGRWAGRLPRRSWAFSHSSCCLVLVGRREGVLHRRVQLVVLVPELRIWLAVLCSRRSVFRKLSGPAQSQVQPMSHMAYSRPTSASGSPVARGGLRREREADRLRSRWIAWNCPLVGHVRPGHVGRIPEVERQVGDARTPSISCLGLLGIVGRQVERLVGGSRRHPVVGRRCLATARRRRCRPAC